MSSRTVVRSAFTPGSILVMVAGFIIAWPIGLAVLAYILWGERFGWRARLESFVDGVRSGVFASRFQGFPGGGPYTGGSGNAAFDAYRARELERLEAERRRLEAERREFEAYMANLRRARDQEEFDRFKADRAKHRRFDDDVRI